MEEDFKLAKWLNNELTEAELTEFKATEEYAKYERISRYSAQLKVSDFNQEKLLENVLSSKKQKTTSVKFTANLFFKAAAILVVCLGLTYVIFQQFTTQNVVALKGKKIAIQLPDNSEVVLNSGSEIDYKNWNWNENKSLTLNGEAYFKVKKSKKFEVVTHLGKVVVLGTQFDVKARDNRFEVCCFEGKVKVNYRNKTLVLTKGMQVVFENNSQINTTTMAIEPDWMQHQILCNKESLTAILKEMERQYNISIENKSTQSEVLFSGVIPANNLDIALKIISKTYNLKNKKITKNTVVIEDN